MKALFVDVHRSLTIELSRFKVQIFSDCDGFSFKGNACPSDYLIANFNINNSLTQPVS